MFKRAGALAKAVGVSTLTIVWLAKWCETPRPSTLTAARRKEIKRPSLELAFRISKATRGAVTVHELLPEHDWSHVYGHCARVWGLRAPVDVTFVTETLDGPTPTKTLGVVDCLPEAA